MNRLSINLPVHEGVAVNVEDLGLNQLKGFFGTADLDVAVRAFGKSVAQTWYLAVALAAVSVVGSGMTGWKSVKEKGA